MESNNRILIVTNIYPPEIGGPASYCHALAKKLAENNKIKVITYSPVTQYSADKSEKFQIVRVWDRNIGFLKRFIYFIKIFFAARNSDSILALNAVSAGVPAQFAARFFKKKFFVKIVGDYAWELAVNMGKTVLMINDFQKNKKQGWIKKIANRQTRVCNSAHKVIVPSEYLKSLVVNWGVKPENIVVIYNGIDPEPLTISKEEARVKIGIPGSIILSAGRLVSWKGYKMLIKIMPQLLSINQFLRLVIVGDGPERTTLETMVKNLRLEKKIYIIGRKNHRDLAVYLKAADIFILNTGYEGFSHQILEAMAFGVPVITTGVGGNREIIEQGENGFMVRYNDEFNLIEAIKTLWQSKELKDHFIEEGKKTVEKFSFQKMLDATTALLIS
jgi:glycosyltransferase involved in cell wall biosynthesis